MVLSGVLRLLGHGRDFDAIGEFLAAEALLP